MKFQLSVKFSAISLLLVTILAQLFAKFCRSKMTAKILTCTRSIPGKVAFTFCLFKVNRENGFETLKSSLLYVFVGYFGVNPVQIFDKI